MIERLDMNGDYSENEVAIHLNRYLISKEYCKNKKVLDISCGEGYGSYLISTWDAKEVVGIDISKEAIDSANKNFKNDNLKFLEQDATNLKDIEDNYFDLIVSFETFEHILDVNKYLEEIKRVAKKDAIIIVSCPNDYYYYPSDEEKNPFHQGKYSFDDFRGVAEKCLGNNVKYLIGKELMGYANVIYDSKFSNLKNKNIVNSFDDIVCRKVKNEKALNIEECNYYVGLWNAPFVSESSCIYPHMYTEWKNARDLLSKDNEQLKKYNQDLEKSIEQLKSDNEILRSYNDDLKLEIKKLTRDLERESILNKILVNQKDEVNSYSSYLWEELNGAKIDIDRLKKENLDYYDKIETLKMQMGYITNSRSYKITRKIAKLVKRK